MSRARPPGFAELLITTATIVAAVAWAFPLYWALVTTLKPEDEVVQPGIALLPHTFTLGAYAYVFRHTIIGTWYVNSLVTSVRSRRW